MASLGRFELPTFRLGGGYSILLSYKDLTKLTKHIIAHNPLKIQEKKQKFTKNLHFNTDPIGGKYPKLSKQKISLTNSK